MCYKFGWHELKLRFLIFLMDFFSTNIPATLAKSGDSGKMRKNTAEKQKVTKAKKGKVDAGDIKQADESLDFLSGRLIEAEENERSRMARELHDNINQRIALISIELEQLAQKVAVRGDGLGERIKSLQVKTRDLSSEIHRLSYELHPSKLDYFGVSAALSSLCREVATRHGLTVNFRDEGVKIEPPVHVGLCIFRVAQESINNAVRHSGASSLDVELRRSGRTIKLVVSDCGRGFDTESGQTFSGLGFVNMRERLRLLKGQLKVSSKRSHGTRVEATVPLH